jgi:hypothetical protein
LVGVAHVRDQYALPRYLLTSSDEISGRKVNKKQTNTKQHIYNITNSLIYSIELSYIFIGVGVG